MFGSFRFKCCLVEFTKRRITALVALRGEQLVAVDVGWVFFKEDEPPGSQDNA